MSADIGSGTCPDTDESVALDLHAIYADSGGW